MIKIDQLFLDLDGVLVDFERGIIESVNEYAGPKRNKIDDNVATVLDEILAKIADGHEVGELLSHKLYKETIRRIIGMEPEWWTHLHWMPGGKELWDAIKHYNPVILSSPLNRTQWQKKITWVKRELGPDVTIIIEDDKEIYATSSSLLIDDRPHHSNFVEHGGHVIKHVTTKNTLNELKNYDMSTMETHKYTYERKIMNFNGFVNESKSRQK